MTDRQLPTDPNDPAPRYSCFVEGCPGNHASKHMVCEATYEQMVRSRNEYYECFVVHRARAVCFREALVELAGYVRRGSKEEQIIHKALFTVAPAPICPFYQDGIHRPEKYVDGTRCRCEPAVVATPSDHVLKIVKEAAEHIEDILPRPGPYHPKFAALIELADRLEFVPRGPEHE